MTTTCGRMRLTSCSGRSQLLSNLRVVSRQSLTAPIFQSRAWQLGSFSQSGSRPSRVAQPISHTSCSATSSVALPPSSPSPYLPHHLQAMSELGSLTEQHALEMALSHLRQALGICTDARMNHEVVLSGHGVHLGADIVWSLKLRPDGAFVEEIVGKHLKLKFGHDGAPSSSVWEVDSTGLPKALEFDDHEIQLLSLWLKTGAWLLPQLRDRMDMRLMPTQETDNVDTAVRNINLGWDEAFCDAPPATFSGRSTDSSKEVWIAVRLRGGRMVAKMRVDSLTWQPLALSAPMCGDNEVWQFAMWAVWDEGLLYPIELLHHVYAGGRQHYVVTSGKVLPKAAAPLMPNAYTMPPCPCPMKDTDFDPSIPPQVPAWITRSGHIIVKPTINGKETGYFLLDTGASGFVIEQEAADALGMQSFGELYVASIAGKVKSSFRKAQNLQLGPVTIRDPIMMEMPMTGVVRGGPQPIVGIVGYEFFRRTVVQIPAYPPSSARSSRATATATGTNVTVNTTGSRSRTHAASVTGSRSDRGQSQYQVLVHNPAEEKPDWNEEHLWEWMPLHMVSNLPHIQTSFKAQDGMVHNTLFMLDTGASGADCMFHSRAIEEMNLLSPKMQAAKHRQKVVKGVGGEHADSMRTMHADLAWLQVASNRYQNVRALFALSGGLDISLYSSGIVCADLITRTSIIVDYSRKRIGWSKVDTWQGL